MSLKTYYVLCKLLLILEPKKTYPEVESVPGLLLRVNAIRFGPADSSDISLVALLEIDELKKKEHEKSKMNIM